jgi:site-specific recombinase XerD
MPTATAPGTTLDSLAPEWAASLRGSGRAARTVEAYIATLRQLDAFLAGQGMPRTVEGVRREHLEAYIADLYARGQKPSSASMRFRALQAFYHWADSEDLLAAGNPIARMTPPAIPEAPVPVPTEDELERLLNACRGPSFVDKRDTAMIRLFIATGCRLSEIANLRLADLDMEARILTVVGKGSRVRVVPISDKAAQALHRYLRLRGRHPLAGQLQLWLGARGRVMSVSGVYQAIVTRATAAGIALHPHQLRHHAAHAMLKAGYQETDVMRLLGWRDRAMLSRYAASTGMERAHAAARAIGFPGDNL